MALGMLHDRRRTDRQVRTILVDRSDVLLQAGAKLDARALGLQPFAVGIRPLRLGAGSADIRNFGTRFDEQPRHQQLRAFIARHRDAALDRLGRKRASDGRQELVLCRGNSVGAYPAGIADRSKPRGSAVAANRRAAHHLAACGMKLPHTGGVEWVDRGNRSAVERRIQLAPLTRRYHRPSGEPHRFEHHRDAHRVGREHFTEQGYRRQAGAFGRRRDRPRHGFLAGIGEHGAGEHVLGLGMGRHAEPRHVDADDAHAVYDIW